MSEDSIPAEPPPPPSVTPPPLDAEELHRREGAVREARMVVRAADQRENARAAALGPGRTSVPAWPAA